MHHLCFAQQVIVYEEEFWEIAEDRVKKEQPIPQLGGKSFRRLAQTLGTEWGRNCVGDSIWCDIVLDRVGLSLDEIPDLEGFTIFPKGL